MSSNNGTPMEMAKNKENVLEYTLLLIDGDGNMNTHLLLYSHYLNIETL